MTTEEVVVYLLGGMYLAMILGIVALVIACPFLLVAGWLPAPWQTARHVAALTGAVVALVGTAAIAGYFLVDTHHFREAPMRGDQQTYWEMHGEEVLFARTYPADNPHRIRTEQAVAADRRWYAERTALLIAALLAGTYTGYAAYRLDRTRGTPPPEWAAAT